MNIPNISSFITTLEKCIYLMCENEWNHLVLSASAVNVQWKFSSINAIRWMNDSCASLRQQFEISEFIDRRAPIRTAYLRIDSMYLPKSLRTGWLRAFTLYFILLIISTTDTFIHKLKYTIQWQYILKIRLVLVWSCSHHQQQKKNNGSSISICFRMNFRIVYMYVEKTKCKCDWLW